MKRATWRERPILPDGSRVEIQLLILLRRRGRWIRPAELYDELGDMVALDDPQRQARRFTREERAWNNRVQTARKHLVERGFLNGARPGFWALTKDGEDEADKWEKILAEGLSGL